MSTHAYTEEHLVEQPAIGLFAALGWETAAAMEEGFGAGSTLGRETSGEVVLFSRLRSALERLNASRMGHNALPPEAIGAAVDELTRDRSAMLLEQANREVYLLLKEGIRVSVPDTEPSARTSLERGSASSTRHPGPGRGGEGGRGGQKIERVRVIDWEHPANNDFLRAKSSVPGREQRHRLHAGRGEIGPRAANQGLRCQIPDSKLQNPTEQGGAPVERGYRRDSRIDYTRGAWGAQGCRPAEVSCRCRSLVREVRPVLQTGRSSRASRVREPGETVSSGRVADRGRHEPRRAQDCTPYPEMRMVINRLRPGFTGESQARIKPRRLNHAGIPCSALSASPREPASDHKRTASGVSDPTLPPRFCTFFDAGAAGAAGRLPPPTALVLRLCGYDGVSC